MKKYDTGKHHWVYGTPVEWAENRAVLRWMLGPCPRCGYPTSNYGGTYSCHNDYCQNSASNFVCRPDDKPQWWNTDIDVKLDSNAWCATGKGFVNLQESLAGFGDTPKAAVEDLYAATEQEDGDE